MNITGSLTRPGWSLRNASAHGHTFGAVVESQGAYCQSRQYLKFYCIVLRVELQVSGSSISLAEIAAKSVVLLVSTVLFLLDMTICMSPAFTQRSLSLRGVAGVALLGSLLSGTCLSLHRIVLGPDPIVLAVLTELGRFQTLSSERHARQ